MPEPTPTTVIINGAGPVGLTMACTMAMHGIKSRIFDKNAEPAQQSRALAIFPRTLEVFSMLGMLDKVLAEGQRLKAVTMYNESRQLARMDLSDVPSPWNFAIALPQSRTEPILEARLAELGIKVKRSMELIGFTQDAHGVEARYRHADGTEESIQAAWMLGCDGAHSAVRHQLGMNFQGGQYEEEFLLADVKVDTDLPVDEASLFLSKDGLLALFPFRGGRARIIADERPGIEHDGEMPTMEELREVVKRRCPQRMEISDDHWKAWFRISHRMVEHYSAGRAYLAGDAAHIHSPAGGQGMNTGIQDAFNLGWKLALVAQGKAAPALLESYEAERMPVARSVVNITDRMTRMGTAQHPAAQHLRDLLLPVVAGIPFVKEAMAGRMSEVAIGYRDSKWVENHGLGPVQAGDRAPDAMFFDRTLRQERSVFDLLKVPGFLLLAFEGYDSAVMDGAALGGLPGAVYRVTRPGQAHDDGTLEDRDCQGRTIYGAGEEGLLVLIRPDGYVGFRGEKVAALKGYVARLTGAE